MPAFFFLSQQTNVFFFFLLFFLALTSALSFFIEKEMPDKAPAASYTDVLIEDTLGLGINGLAAFPGAMVLFVMVFMLETLVALPDAKLYFVLGFVLLMVPFYTICSMCFPQGGEMEFDDVNDDGGDGGGGQRGGGGQGGGIFGRWGGGRFKKSGGGGPTSSALQCLRSMMPFSGRTTASFYNFAAGYLFGYWSNLNINKKTPNAVMLTCYYFAIVFFTFVFSTFYVNRGVEGEWKAGLASAAFGIIGGMVWSAIIAPKVPDAAAASASSAGTLGMRAGALGSDSGSDSSGSSASDGTTTTCNGGSNDDSVCTAFLQERPIG